MDFEAVRVRLSRFQVLFQYYPLVFLRLPSYSHSKVVSGDFLNPSPSAVRGADLHFQDLYMAYLV